MTNHVKNGSLAYEAPGDGDYVLLAFWQRRTGYLAAQGAFDNATNSDNPASWFAYVVDHYSQAGTDLWTNFTEQYVMNGENGDLLRQLGLYAWEDSVRILMSATFGLIHALTLSHRYVGGVPGMALLD